MTTLATQSFLQTNLVALGERNQDLAELLQAAEPRDDLIFADSAQGVATATLAGKALASRHRPLDEAERLIGEIDLVEHAVVIVLGFGLGYHVQKLAERMQKAGVVIVFEPDVSLLRSVFEQIDHSKWTKQGLIVWVTDAQDRGTIGRKLEGAEAIIAQGVEILEHPASRARLGDSGRAFAAMFSEFVSTAKTTLMTTLMRSVDTIRNLGLNVDHYAAGPGIADLKDAAMGKLGIVVSAGPSLRRNIHLLTEPGARERCVIIAVQTMLKPLLAMGVKPHFIAALDYHEISRRFYEGLQAENLADVTLIADPKVHPSVIDSFPGPMRCCEHSFLDQLLGELKRPMGTLPPGATVAHLCMYFARFLGCDPIALIGQDLGFTDGLYYTPGTSYHDVWAPELNPFNTIEMMEWQRIVRHRTHLKKLKDVQDKSIFTDLQMATYLQQFERDFAKLRAEGVRVIDATEGGVAKQHVEVMPLADVLGQFAKQPIASLPVPARELDRTRLETSAKQVERMRYDVVLIERTSRQTIELIRRMLDDQTDQAKMRRHFEKMERNRRVIDEHFAAFELLSQLNQMGVFKRMKADRRIHLSRDKSPIEHQQAQLQRDLENVTWIADAAAEMSDLLADSIRVLKGERIERRQHQAKLPAELKSAKGSEESRIAALVPVDPQCNALGIERSLAAPFRGRPVIQATLERIGQCGLIESIILIVPEGFDVEPLIDRARIGGPVEIERCEGSPFVPERRAIAAARLWADASWRGGIAGIGACDEALAPGVMSKIMDQRGLTAAVIAAPDWPLIQVRGPGGIDSLIERHRENPQQHSLVFTQHPPGLGACLLSAKLMRDFAGRNRLSTIGGILTYQPHTPQHDPIAREANVQIAPDVRKSLVRATFDSPRGRRRVLSALEKLNADSMSEADLVRAIEAAGELDSSCESLPQQLILEITTQRAGRGIIAGQLGAEKRGRESFLGRESLQGRSVSRAAHRPRRDLPVDLARRIFDQLARTGDAVVTMHGAGDPLLHPQLDDIIRIARAAGVRGIHVRTELLCDRSTVDRLLAADVDVISVDLHADRAATYETMMGVDRFKDVLLNIEHLVKSRRRLTDHPGTAGFAIPWIVPRLQRRAETYEDIDSFFDRWQHALGTAVIEGPPRVDESKFTTDALAEAIPPPQVVRHELQRRMTILCDGSAVVSELDHDGATTIGNAADAPLSDLWLKVCAERNRIGQQADANEAMLRMYRP